MIQKRLDRWTLIFTIFIWIVGLVVGRTGVVDYVHENAKLQWEVREDVRYEIAEAIETRYPEFYVVDVVIRSDEEQGNSIELYLMFNRRVTRPKFADAPIAGPGSIYTFLCAAEVDIALLVEELGYDWVAIASLYVYEADRLGGTAWVAEVYHAVWGVPTGLAEWDAAERDKSRRAMEKYEIGYFDMSPFQSRPRYEDFMPRPWEAPLWIQLEEWEESK